MKYQKFSGKLAFALVIGSAVASSVHAAEFQAESCQFIGEITDSERNSVPPGLDEPLNCDHKCFYDELGLDSLGEEKPTLHDMYSIGWRLIDVEKTQFYKKQVWTLYLERHSDSSTNQCERTYAPKRPNNTDDQGNS